MENSMVLVSDTPQPVPLIDDNSNLNRDDFPKGFLFGTGTASFQVEGAAAVDGKAPSIWDDFTLRTPGRILDGSNGNVAADMYNRFREDIRTMKKMGFEVYRFSISWPRILPGGRSSAGVNRAGIDFYNNLIDTIISHGLIPCATLYHWDHPDILEKEYEGFLSKKIVPDFREYAEVCFFEFGDRVKWWTTINEGWTVAVNGYVRGTFPPSKASVVRSRVLRTLPPYRSIQDQAHTVSTERTYSDVKFDKSDPAKDAYTVARNLLLAHAAAVHSYRTKFKEFQHGQIGMVCNSHWYVPYDENSEADKAAAKRAVDFMLGWFLEPILYGHYPQSMIDSVPPENLASFSHYESQLLKGSTDFVGFNYYTTNYAANDPNPTGVGYDADMHVLFSNERDGIPIGEPSGSTWLTIVPWGIYEHLVYFKENYKDLPPLYVTENGVSDKSDFKLTAREACVDPRRVRYHQDHLANIKKAIDENQVNVKGYIVWSWCDNFEWAEGYTSRFGINYVDYINNCARYPKHSAMWFSKFLRSRKKVYLDTSRKRILDEDENENGTEKRQKTVGV